MSRILLASPRRRGFTIAELMVSMAIALLLTVVIAQVFLDTRKNYTVQDDQARVQENSRYAVQTISRIVRQSAYRSYPGLPSTTYFSSTTTPAITGVNGGGSASDQTPADQITLRFQGSGDASGTADNTVFDCRGNSYGFGIIGMSTFAIRSGGTDGSGLFCTIVDPATAVAGDWVELVPGVENMQILYGLDTDSPVDRTANAYLRINDISGTSSNLDKIVSARFSLLMRSPSDSSPTLNATTYSLNGVSVGPLNDRRVRRVVNFTVNLRNRTP